MNEQSVVCALCGAWLVASFLIMWMLVAFTETYQGNYDDDSR